mgnify:CR=1 FL=1
MKKRKDCFFGLHFDFHAQDGMTVADIYRPDTIERMLDAKVFLDLYVRVKENWRDSDFNISDFGYREEE